MFWLCPDYSDHHGFAITPKERLRATLKRLPGPSRTHQKIASALLPRLANWRMFEFAGAGPPDQFIKLPSDPGRGSIDDIDMSVPSWRDMTSYFFAPCHNNQNLHWCRSVHFTSFAKLVYHSADLQLAPLDVIADTWRSEV